VAPRAEERQSACDHHCRDNGSNGPCADSATAIVKTSSVIGCPGTKSRAGIKFGAIVTTRLIIKITHFRSPNVDQERPFNYQMVPIKRRARGIVPARGAADGTSASALYDGTDDRPQRSFILDISTSSNSDLFQSAAY
jgi:hypothetical protein